MQRYILPLAVAVLLAFAGPVSAADWHEQQQIQQVRQVFHQLEEAYEKEDVELFLSCFTPCVTSVDVPRNTVDIYTETETRTELGMLFAMLDGIKMDFLDLQIAVEGDAATATTVRRGAVTGLPTIYVKMVYTLRLNSAGAWIIDGDVILDEWMEM
ncbi:MAG: hypothetical protein ACM3XS_03720, partial [Bacteroidota bacterium]